MKKISFTVEGDVFETIRFIEPLPTEMHKKILNGFLNNPTAIDVTNFTNVGVGWKLSGDTFIPGDQPPSSLSFLEQTGSERDPDSSYFAFLSNGEVFTFSILKNTDSKHDMYKAAFSTGVSIIVEEV